MLRIRAWLNRHAHLALRTEHLINASRKAFLLSKDHSIHERTLQHGRIVIPSAVFVHDDQERLAVGSGMLIPLQKLHKAFGQHSTLASPMGNQLIETLWADDDTADESPNDPVVEAASTESGTGYQNGGSIGPCGQFAISGVPRFRD